jgi:hypothetical protein
VRLLHLDSWNAMFFFMVQVEKMEEMLSDVCGELDIVKTGKAEECFAPCYFSPCHTGWTMDPDSTIVVLIPTHPNWQQREIISAGAKGVQAENSKLRSAIAQLEEEVQALTRANEEGAGGSKAKELEGRVVELEGLLDCERRARAEAEEEVRASNMNVQNKSCQCTSVFQHNADPFKRYIPEVLFINIERTHTTQTRRDM